jgi:hypothetical protein
MSLVSADKDAVLGKSGAAPGALAANDDRVESARELGPAEALTNQAHLFGALMAGGLMRISGPITPELVQRALDWLQDEHPILRAHIVRKGTRFLPKLPFVEPVTWFETRGTAPIPLHDVIDPDPRAGMLILQAELRKPIPVGPLPRIKAALVRASADADSADLIMCVDHTIADAQSAMMSMGQLMEFLGDPDGMRPPRGIHQPLPPSLDSVLAKKSDNRRPYEPMIRLPITRSPKSDIGTAVEMRSFSKTDTDAIKEQLKVHKATIHGLVTAAVLKGINEQFSLPQMTVLSSVDLRRYCRPVVATEIYGCYIDVLRTKHDIAQPLWDVARDVTFKLIATLARDHHSASALKAPTWEMLRAELWPLVSSGFRGDGLVITTAGETNLKRRYGPFVLEGLTGMISQEVMGAGFFCVALEKQGALEFSLCYAPHMLPKADAAAVADIAARHLQSVAAA